MAITHFVVNAYVDFSNLVPGTLSLYWASPGAVLAVFLVLLHQFGGRRKPIAIGSLAMVLALALAAHFIGGLQPLNALLTATFDLVIGALSALFYRRLVGGRLTVSRPVDVPKMLLATYGIALPAAFLAGPAAGLGLVDGVQGAGVGLMHVYWGMAIGHHLFTAGLALILIWWFPSQWNAHLRVDIPTLLGVAAVLGGIGTIMTLFPEQRFVWVVVIAAIAQGLISSPVWVGIGVYLSVASSIILPLVVTRPSGFPGPVPEIIQVNLIASVSAFASVILALYRHRLTEASRKYKAERAVAAEQADLLAGVFQSMTDAVLVLDADREVVVANSAAFRLFGGVQPGPITQWSSFDGVHAEDGSWSDIGALLATPLPRYSVHRGIRDGQGSQPATYLEFEVTQLGSDAAHRTLIVVTDTTKERLYQDELRSFAGVVAHDLKSPLTSLEGWLEVLEDEGQQNLAPLQRKALGAARRGGAQLRALIEDWLGVTVAENTDPQSAPVDLGSLVGEVVGQLPVDGPDRRRPVVQVEAPDRVLADPVMMRQVLANLLGNAVKYADPARPTTIEVHTRPVEGDRVEVSVRDNGVGIPPGEESRIFDAGHRAPDHVGRFAGTGRGLALCSRVVQRHGGRIRVRNNADGPGATFTFTLPSALVGSLVVSSDA